MSETIEQREQHAHWLHLVLTAGLGPVRIYALLREFGLPEDALKASHTELSNFIEPALARTLHAPDEARSAAIERNLQWAQHPNRHLLAFGDPNYPAALLNLTDPPPLLWAIGDLRLLRQPSLAIVGSRSATHAGTDRAHGFAQTLGQAGWTIVSGLALGIDAAAHRGGLATEASTIAVLAHGLEKIYPASNRALGLAIAGKGLLVSEFALGSLPLRDHFPRRNRLIAALSQGVLVIEAARQSGSLITARLAAEMGRDVFAIPGSIDSPMAKGCHDLIKQGAKLVDQADDILQELRTNPGSTLAAPSGPDGAASLANGAATLANGTATLANGATNLGPAAEAVLEALGWDPASVDQLVDRSELQVAHVNSQLLSLELAGQIERLADGRIQRLQLC